MNYCRLKSTDTIQNSTNLNNLWTALLCEGKFKFQSCTTCSENKRCPFQDVMCRILAAG